MSEIETHRGKPPEISKIQTWYARVNIPSGFFVLTLALLIVSGCRGLRPAEVKTEVKTKVIDGFSSPESVIADRDGSRFFVSNVGEKLEPSAKDGDGFISELTPDGAVVNRNFLPKEGVLNAPKGMAIIGQTLFVTDIDRVVGFDMATRQKTFELDFSAEKTVFLNDLAVFDDKTLFVSATDRKSIRYRSAQNRRYVNVKRIPEPRPLLRQGQRQIVRSRLWRRTRRTGAWVIYQGQSV